MIIKCENGHWYDANVNKTCPHCKRESEKLSIRLDNDIEEDDRTISIAEVDLSLGEELGAIIGQSAGSAISNMPEMDTTEDGDKTISFGFFGMTDTQPVTGWLVCTTGTERGKDYRLHTGKNFVGRSTSMDVVLIDDKTISREKHCSVVHEPKENVFYVSPENGNVTYVNDKIIDKPVAIQEGDEITIGDTKLVFIPFCKEGRLWESK
jgi:hypothetical protein